jgi:hypothetical protein
MPSTAAARLPAPATLHKVPSTISYTVAKLEETWVFSCSTGSARAPSRPKDSRALLDEGGTCCARPELELRVRRVASGWETELTCGGFGVPDLAARPGYRRIS